ncbi:MAG TPA: Gfo/Idh/MocA family oxidoreductase [Candidatus Scybalocola faecigallinarum]|uniref:Gfo/Idh/MocA family oxidoreductase n=1 Tax=Candidatus Scybalocola faecigallinarum TaxID=2840941 RepID=A0A9D1F5Q5_9FIRM|nr:Gfo/Idh/MocA family oxidoreductase [Candidatus Scybalocola faecigallinarum]
MSDAVLNQFTPQKKEKQIDTSKKLKFGIIGTGWIAESHVESLMKMPDVIIAAGADIIPGKAKEFFSRYGLNDVRCYESHTELLEKEELDAVCICTYNKTHAQCAIDALNAGVHVLLEKPMCVTTEEALAIIEAEKASNCLLSIGFQPRMDKNMQMIKKIVDSGELGKIYYIQTGGGRRRGIPNSTFIEEKTAGIGALGDIGCYSLDMVLNAIGYPKPLTVSGYKSAYFGTNPKYNNPEDAARFDVDDFAAAFIRLEGDIVLDFRIAWAMHIDTPGDTIILGTEGALRIPSTECWNGSIGGPLKIYKDVAGKQVEFEIPPEAEPGDGWGLFDMKLRSFADAIKENLEPPVPSSQILYNQAILDAIVRSAKLGHEVEVNLP